MSGRLQRPDGTSIALAGDLSLQQCRALLGCQRLEFNRIGTQRMIAFNAEAQQQEEIPLNLHVHPQLSALRGDVIIMHRRHLQTAMVDALLGK